MDIGSKVYFRGDAKRTGVIVRHSSSGWWVKWNDGDTTPVASQNLVTNAANASRIVTRKKALQKLQAFLKANPQGRVYWVMPCNVYVTGGRRSAPTAMSKHNALVSLSRPGQVKVTVVKDRFTIQPV